MPFLKKHHVYSLLLVVCIVLIATVAFLSAKPKTQPTGVTTDREATADEKRNILINQDERNKIRKDFYEKIGRQSNTAISQLHLTYQISPKFQEKREPTSTHRNVLGVSSVCNLGTVPAQVWVYDLRSHWLVNESQQLAAEYGITSIPFSLPTETAAYQYHFIRPDNTAYLTQYEPSGVYTFGQAGSDIASATPDEIRQKAGQYLEEHVIKDNVGVPQVHNVGTDTIFEFRKTLYDFMLVDQASIQSFFDQANCTINESDIMGTIELRVDESGDLRRLTNNNRLVLNSYKMDSIPVSQALQEYGDSPPLDPIIFPANATINQNKSVMIDAAVIAYYDVGLNFGQNLYIPMYIAHGFGKSTTGTDVQILTFFPAVSSRNLLNKGLVRTVPLPGSQSTQQQGTLGFATPTPHMPPPFPSTAPGGIISGPGCPGGNLGYMISCSVDGNIICRGHFTTPATPDTVNACATGCASKVAVVDVTTGANPCETFMRQNNITPDIINDEIPHQRIAPSGKVSCVLDACAT